MSRAQAYSIAHIVTISSLTGIAAAIALYLLKKRRTATAENHAAVPRLRKSGSVHVMGTGSAIFSGIYTDADTSLTHIRMRHVRTDDEGTLCLQIEGDTPRWTEGSVRAVTMRPNPRMHSSGAPPVLRAALLTPREDQHDELLLLFNAPLCADTLAIFLTPSASHVATSVKQP